MYIEEVTKFIFVEHLDEQSDLIFVFGTGKSLRQSVQEAVNLYKNKISPKILFTGGVNDFTHENEADVSLIEATKAGVPESDILIENKATNTMENVVFSMKIIDEKIGLENIKSITAVVKNFHARRALMTLRKFLPKHIEIRSHAYTSVMFPFTKHNWHEQEDWKKLVLGEVEKIKNYTQKGHLAEI